MCGAAIVTILPSALHGLRVCLYACRDCVLVQAWSSSQASSMLTGGQSLIELPWSICAWAGDHTSKTASGNCTARPCPYKLLFTR